MPFMHSAHCTGASMGCAQGAEGLGVLGPETGGYRVRDGGSTREEGRPRISHDPLSEGEPPAPSPCLGPSFRAKKEKEEFWKWKRCRNTAKGPAGQVGGPRGGRATMPRSRNATLISTGVASHTRDGGEPKMTPGGLSRLVGGWGGAAGGQAAGGNPGAPRETSWAAGEGIWAKLRSQLCCPAPPGGQFESGRQHGRRSEETGVVLPSQMGTSRHKKQRPGADPSESSPHRSLALGPQARPEFSVLSYVKWSSVPGDPGYLEVPPHPHTTCLLCEASW